ncbi:hypothetical protein LNQ82_03710 [Conchiformibius steedae DSM 2580]|uniref:Uncharacterized protein n=1 Tax=Conchiformibius steedae DSM 2580 TaxID=1121352 RepID=A0AAE9L0Y2_9NEIS|nr:hypothetical protein [Conchiformibius steedae]QMT33617.1 hypothetical protein H3L98_00785 [Conchiformibius steedae]URD68275.1 hypothetical protein LNQ82_03710 [Conchiformibius steedae DSM 2580]
MNTQQRKAAHKAALAERLQTEHLHRVEGVGDLEIYVKSFTVAEASQTVKKTEELIAKYQGDQDDGLNQERRLAFELFDEDGDLYFNPENHDDLMLLSLLPYGLRQKLLNATVSQFQSETLLKKLLATETVS